MKKDWLIKTLALGIVVLFIGTGVASPVQLKTDNILKIIQFPKMIGIIIYVDDDNTQGPWYGTIKHPYRYIKDGVNNAIPGGIVFVFNGTYNEYNIHIEKPLKIIGEDRENTIIDGGGHWYPAFFIYSFFVTIKKFTIIGCREGIMIYTRGFNVISKNNIYNCGDGVVVTGDGNPFPVTIYNRIKDNIIKDNSDYGIFVDYSYRTTIIGNHIESNSGVGVYIDNTILNIIKKNNFIGNTPNAYFKDSILNFWNRNYWDDWDMNIPYRIQGEDGWYDSMGNYHSKGIVNFDRHPAKEPYEI